MNENNTPLISRQMVLFGIAAVLIMFGMAAWAWGRIELPVPTNENININGDPDTVAKFWGLMMMPLMTAGTAALLLFLPLIPSQRANLERSRKAYQMLFYTFMLFMIGFHAMIVQLMISGGKEIGNMVQFLMIGMGLLFIVIGNYSTTIRRNHIFGFRTRWTLSSDYAWRKTHRVGGWLFMGMGSLYILYALLRPDDEMMILHVIWSLMLMTLFTMVYSYWMWRNDPDRAVS